MRIIIEIDKDADFLAAMAADASTATAVRITPAGQATVPGNRGSCSP